MFKFFNISFTFIYYACKAGYVCLMIIFTFLHLVTPVLLIVIITFCRSLWRQRNCYLRRFSNWLDANTKLPVLLPHSFCSRTFRRIHYLSVEQVSRRRSYRHKCTCTQIWTARPNILLTHVVGIFELPPTKFQVRVVASIAVADSSVNVNSLLVASRLAHVATTAKPTFFF